MDKADKYFRKGYTLYGPFLDRKSLAKGLTEMAIDIATGVCSRPVLMNLADAFEGEGYNGVVLDMETRKSVHLKNIYVGYALPKESLVKDASEAFKLTGLRTTTGQIISLRGVSLIERG